TTLAGEAARRCLADIVWEDAFSFSARTTWARAGQAEGKAEEVAAQHNLLESYDREQQFDWSCLPKGQRDYVENLFRQKEAVDRDGKIRVECFGPFRVLLPDAAEEVRWRTKKAQELFAYLFHLQGQAVNKETILLHLWPDTDKESATSLLHTSLYSIRKMLALQRLEDVIVYDKKKYAMNMEMVQSTLDKMNPLCRALEQHDEAFVYNCREILYACCGEYLGGVTNEYAVAPRAYYEQKFLQLSETAARKSMEKQEWAEAVSLLDMAIGVDPFEESLYQLILQCFRSMKDLKRARRYYTRLKDILRDELDVEPSPEVTAAYRYCLESGTGLRDMAAV
ncbi:MAG: hypothetical protein FWH49_08435, partial [Clostridiales bacterium]|nr:hypothetical protein [Clostridiales bacterium]